MAFFSCFSSTAKKKKKDKKDGSSQSKVKNNNGLTTVEKQLEQPVASTDKRILDPTSVNAFEPLKIINRDAEEIEASETAYEGEDEYNEKSTRKRGISGGDLEANRHKLTTQGFEFELGRMKMNDPSKSFAEDVEEQFEMNTEKDGDDDIDKIQDGHLSDPGMAAREQWASPKLKRSCSSLDTREVLKKIADQFPSSKSQSFEELQKLAEEARENVFKGSPMSHLSVVSHHSADEAILKKQSSSQILPSRSRKLWWKLFLWSHRNLQKPWPTKTTPFPLDQLGGYSSDTLETSRAKRPVEPESPLSFSAKPDDESNVFQGGVSSFWPQNQWVAFSMQSSTLKRIEDWVNDLEIESSTPAEGEFGDEGIVFPPSPETSRTLARPATLSTHEEKLNLPEDVLHANSVVQSLNSSSTVAHISGMGLRALPTISHFWKLRSVNLSNNNIAHLTPGSLPKGLQIIDLSRNKISTIEGLRESTRLRVLNLSYNRISHVGHGLSNCPLLKELYLAGNKIGEVEGLHRLLKLTLLDLSFNKITTTKSIGQLVGNYHSIVALNLLGNPIHSSLSDEQLRKAVCGLLPKLAYLNKQPINQQKAREVGVDIIAKASSGKNDLSSRRRTAKRTTTLGGNAKVGQSSRSRLKSKGHRR
ncbi:phosphatase 1 regulatory subunit SDS22-like protein [Drosera capensis]